MSRPSSSLPNQCSALGPANRSRRSPVSGSYGASTSANTAVPMYTTTSARPMTAPRFLLSRRQAARSAEARPAAMAIAGAASASSPAVSGTDASRTDTASVPDARIDQRVGEVDDQVYEQEGNRDQQDAALDHRIVAGEDRVHHEPSDAWQGEHRLDEDRASQQRAELQADHGDYRIQRVAERVLVDDESIGHAIRAQRPDEVLADDFEHRRAGQAGLVCGARYAEHDRGQDQVLRRAAAACREPAELGGEELHQDQAEPEAGHGDTRQRYQGQTSVEPRVLVHRRQDAQQNADQRRDCRGDRGELHGELQPRPQGVDHGIAGADGHAEIASNS